MDQIILDSYAKVNLALDVLNRREDGYHNIRSIMQEVSLKDILTFKTMDKGIIIESDNKDVPLDESNLVYKAWEAIKNMTGINKGIYIKIEKHIPIAAGLAGGSSNAAATLKALNILWELGLSMEQLMEIGKKLGADIPFCLLGGTALAEGIGEKLTNLKPFKDKYILITNPGIAISAAYAYKDLKINNGRIDIDKLIDCIDKEDASCISKNMKNVLEDKIIKENPIIGRIKTRMLEEGAYASLMSGSGSTVFGLFDDIHKLKKAKDLLLKDFPAVYSCTTI